MIDPMNAWRLNPEIREYYERGGERDRLTKSGRGRLEFARMQDILRRVLPGTELDVLDVGGATGIHAEWLAADGHRVTLIDPVESQVAVAAELPGVTARVGDVRDLPCDDGSFDAVLLMGPLYHLTDPDDRLRALRQARRVAREGGIVAAVTIDRAAGWADWLHMRLNGLTPIESDESLRALKEGDIGYFDHGLFTTAYLHRPGEIAGEFAEAGMSEVRQYAVQGPAGIISELDDILDHDELGSHYLAAMREIECEPSLLGASGHLVTVATVG